jgi:hypothetical protein
LTSYSEVFILKIDPKEKFLDSLDSKRMDIKRICESPHYNICGFSSERSTKMIALQSSLQKKSNFERTIEKVEKKTHSNIYYLKEALISATFSNKSA